MSRKVSPTPAGGGTASPPRASRAAIIALIVMVTFVSFFPLFSNGFVNYDDPGYVTENPRVRAGLTGETLAWAFETVRESNWHPLTWLSHALDATLFGIDPRSHHAMNLLLHIVSACLLFAAFDGMTGRRWPSAFVAIVFAIHPLHVESVAWISERKDVLSGLLMMLTIITYARYTRSGELKLYVLALGFFALGLLAKPMLVTLPFVLLLFDYWPLARFGGEQGRSASLKPDRQMLSILREKIPFLLLALTSSIVTYVAQERGGAIAELGGLPLYLRLENAVVSYLWYLQKTFVPTDLAFFYPHRLASIPKVELVGSALVLLSVSVLVWRMRTRAPYAAVGWALFLGMLVPVLGIVQVGLQAMADRYMYLPIIGLAIIVAWWTPKLAGPLRWGRPGVAFGFVIAVLILGALTWVQTGYWKDNDSLYHHALAVTTGNHVAHTNLGVALADSGRNLEAIPHFREALRLWPANTKNLSNLARSLGATGRYGESLSIYRAIIPTVRPDARLHLRIADVFTGLGETDSALKHYEASHRLDSGMIDPLLGIADIRSSGGDFDGARNVCSRILALEPGSSRGYNMLGVIAGRENRPDEAEAQFRRAMEADASNDQARLDMGILLERTGRVEEAGKYYLEAVRIAPRNTIARTALGTWYARRGDLDNAEKEWSQSLESGGAAIEARLNLGRLYVIRNETAKAISHYRAAIGIDSLRADARYYLGTLLAGQGNIPEATECFRAALRLNPDFVEAAEALKRISP